MRMAYFQRETRELVNLDSCELIHSQFGLVSDYWAGVALDYFAEVAEQLLPSAEPSEKFFRLLLAVLEYLQPAGGQGGMGGCNVFFTMGGAAFGMAAGIACLPELRQPAGRCGKPRTRVFQPRTNRPGVRPLPPRRGRGNSWELTAESRTLAAEMLRVPVGKLSKTEWDQSTAADLRRFLVQQIESHVERKLVTAPLLEG